MDYNEGHLKKYGVIIADPNWLYQNFSESKHGAARSHYDLSSMEEIQSIPVKKFAAKNCVLALWCTWPKLNEGIKVMEKWGFEYITGFPWIKTIAKLAKIQQVYNEKDISQNEAEKYFRAEIDIKIRRGIGFWTQSASEFVLIGKIRHTKKTNNKRADTNRPSSRRRKGVLSSNRKTFS